jgi:hypothetical protein
MRPTCPVHLVLFVTDLKEIVCVGVDWIHLAEERFQWTRLWTSEFHKRWRISWPAERLSISEEELLMELIYSAVKIIQRRMSMKDDQDARNCGGLLLSLNFRSWSLTCNFGFRGWVASDVDSYRTFRQTFQLPSSGWMCRSWAFLEALYKVACRSWWYCWVERKNGLLANGRRVYEWGKEVMNFL